MGEIQNQPFQLSFNASLKIDFQGSRVTSDGGLVLVRELDERFGELIEQHLTDSRRGKNTQFPSPTRLTSMSDGVGGETYLYDQLGRMTRLTKTINGSSYPINYQYNLAGELLSVT